VRFEFRGKSGKRQSRLVHDERLVRIVRRCRDLPGQALFQYRDERGKRHSVTSSHVNNYLREITGREFTAKDFRTWAATVFAAQLLCGQPGRRPHRVARQITVAIAEVADRLGNTPAICRKCYIAPVVFRAFDEGRLSNGRRGNATTRGLRQSERAVLALLAIERRSA
jgi:DNA topoisomerase-1